MKAMVVGLLAAAAVAVAGCGSQEASVLQTAFKHPIKSGNVSMALSAGSVQISLDGPFKSNGARQLPSFDWRIHYAAGTRPVDGEIISTGDNAFVKYDGKTYEVGKAAMARGRAAAVQNGAVHSVDVSQLTSRMRTWFPDTATQQDARLDGEPVTRVTGRLDISKALKGISQLAKSGAPTITQKEIDQADEQITDPRFTVDVGKGDGTLRRILATMRVRGAGGVRFEIRYRDANRPVTIDAPASGLPLAQLERKLRHDFGG